MSAAITKDSNGNQLADGDSVTVIKDLKVKGLVLKTEFLKKA
jgi:protein PhnA